MPFFVTCGCGQQMVLADELAGGEVHCSRCDAALSLPSALSSPPPAPDAANVEDSDHTCIVIRTHLETTRRRMDPHQRRARTMAVGLVVLACIGLLPVVVDSFLSRDMETPRWERWAIAVFWLSMLEASYAVYVWQLVDRSAMRVVSWMALVVAGIYATAAAIRTLAAEGNRATAYWDLDGNAFSSSQEALWCFLMVVLTGLVSYFAGAWSANWSGFIERSSAEH